MNVCPVCGLEGIPPERSQCPQCDADLTCFKILDSLPDEPVGRQAGSQKQLIWIGSGGLLAVVLVVLATVNLYRVRQIESRLEDRETAIVESLANLDAKLQQLAVERSEPGQNSSVTPALPSEASGETGMRLRQHPMPEALPRQIQSDSPASTDAAATVPDAPGERVRGDETETGTAAGTGTSDQDGKAVELLPGESAIPHQGRIPEAVSAEPPLALDGKTHSLAATVSGMGHADAASIPSREPGDGLHPEGRAQAESAFWLYEAHTGDTYWSISRMFYGAGHYYPVLMEHNPEIGLFDVGAGVRMKILKDAGQAKGILRKIVKSEGNRLIWYYTVVAGDTLESIARKFYKTDEKVKRLLDLNPGLKLEPGERIRIELE
jgi:nucleoid-associated protein YgaU